VKVLLIMGDVVHTAMRRSTAPAHVSIISNQQSGKARNHRIEVNHMAGLEVEGSKRVVVIKVFPWQCSISGMTTGKGMLDTFSHIATGLVSTSLEERIY
jgi:hypothetical protein